MKIRVLLLMICSTLCISCRFKVDQESNDKGDILVESQSVSAQYVVDSRFYSAIFKPDQLRLIGGPEAGSPATFAMAAKALPDGETLSFACNGGMYLPDYRPVGLYVQDGKMLHKMSPPSNSSANYNLGFGSAKVNGIFMIDKQGNASIITSSSYDQVKENIGQATQSGPILLWDGEINPNFKAGSLNRLLRNGVGIRPDGNIVFIMADDICFYDFAALFRDEFQCREALFLDGVVSRMYLPSLGLNNLDGSFGVVIYASETAK